MAKEPSVYGFRKDKANTLSRIADRAGLGGGLGSHASYPRPIPSGFIVFTGALTAALDAGSSATVAELDIDDDGVRTYTGEIHTVFDMKLNDGESIPVDTIIDYVYTPGGVFKWITAYCAVSDNLPE